MLGRSLIRRSRRGANAIEFGLTAPIFFGIVLGLMDYGWYFANQAGINNANSLGCREGAMVDPEVGSPEGVAMMEIASRAAMFCGGGCSHSVVDMQSGAYAVPNRTLLCTTTSTFPGLVGFVPLPTSIEATSYYRLEWQRRW